MIDAEGVLTMRPGFRKRKGKPGFCARREAIRTVVVEEGWGGTIDFTDVLLLLKIDGEWKCVAKAYNQNSDTISK